MSPTTKLLRHSASQWKTVGDLVELSTRVSRQTGAQVREEVAPVAASTAASLLKPGRIMDLAGRTAMDELEKAISAVVDDVSDEGQTPITIPRSFAL